jgi:hypothetical protein
LTASEIQEAQRLVDRALKNAKGAEKWAMGATNDDKTGQAHPRDQGDSPIRFL